MRASRSIKLQPSAGRGSRGPVLTLVLIGAVAAILGGLLTMSADILGLIVGQSSDTYSNNPIDKVMAILFQVGKIPVLIGLVGLYLRQAHASGKLGLIAFLVALVGTGLMIASDWSEVFVAPILYQAAPNLIETVGFVLGTFVFLYGLIKERSA